MKAAIFLKKTGEPLAYVENQEVCPRGIYVIDGKVYQLNDQPRFIISKGDDRNPDTLERVELFVEPYNDSDML